MVQVGGRGWWWVSRKYHSIGWNLPLCRQRDLQARTNQNRLSFVMPFSFVCVRLHLWFFVKSPNVFDYSTWKRFRLRHDSFPASGFDIRTPSTSPCRNWSSYPNWRQKKNEDLLAFLFIGKFGGQFWRSNFPGVWNWRQKFHWFWKGAQISMFDRAPSSGQRCNCFVRANFNRCSGARFQYRNLGFQFRLAPIMKSFSNWWQ